MRRLLVYYLTLSLILIGCSNEETNLTSFNNSELKSKLEEQSFHPKVPTKLPFKVSDTSFDAGPPDQKSNTYIIDFYGTENEHLGLTVSRGVAVSTNLETTGVEIGDEKGKFAENKNGVKYLSWEDEGIRYQLQYFSKTSDTEVNKGELIETAKLFQ
ncbi:DUF4367 domain-containing protein [Pontibacillus yanchengensis]|uniref:Uncharacterized protein n=1 Tax=Pontibacillus yanchengensis Y32 TaxID=1385514 RepID=A0A0A2TAT7_9BACI|nr:DUF4367 domain-containing protein [Pontibacillus yanchengensis]KGP72912.1 hypothetical protein N782_09750 [Pontibacillus yanchengensis Y32]